MKKSVLLLIFLLTIPIAYATITIDGPQKQLFNLGDEITISGYVSRDSSFNGFFKLSLLCGSSKIEMPLTSLSLLAGERKLFPNDFSTPKIIANNVEGDCSIEASLLSGSQILETSSSLVFNVTKSLQGKFKLDKTTIQSGDSLTLTGDVLKSDGKPTDGSIELYFKSNNIRFLADIISLKEGKFEYEYKAIPLEDGIYNIDLIARDTFGNTQSFDNIASFSLISNLNVVAKLEKTTIKPGENVKVFGDVKDTFQKLVGQGTARIFFDDSIYNADITNGRFEKEIETDSDIRSGKHLIKVIVEDNLGNSGAGELTFNIQPNAERIDIELNNEKFNPTEVVSINSLIFDQAGSLVIDDVSIEILNSDGKNIFSEVTKANNKISYSLDKFTEPGTYKVIVSAKNLKQESQFEVNEIINAEVSLENQTLVIYNSGNVIYEKPVKVDNGQDAIIKKTSILPDTKEIIELSEEFPTGKYNLIVTYGDKKKEFNDVEIIGNPKKPLTIIYTIIGAVLLVLLLYIFFNKRKRMPRSEPSKKEIIRRDVNIKPKLVDKKTLKYVFGKATDDDLKDFKKRMMEEIKKTEDKRKPDILGRFR